MDNQDWTPVVINSKAKVDAAKKELASKPPGKTNQQKNLESDEPKIRYVDRDISQLIINGRLAKKLNRKQLAIGMMIPESVIADWETGKAIYNGPMLDKFKRYLGVSH
jgi:hypothetical protein